MKMKPAKLGIALCLLWSVHAFVHAQDRQGETRGELLYTTHCSACHTAKIYWREQKRVTDWESLKAEVRRWQASIGLNWSEEEIRDVADYLNTAHYGFPGVSQKGLLQGGMPAQALHQN